MSVIPRSACAFLLYHFSHENSVDSLLSGLFLPFLPSSNRISYFVGSCVIEVLVVGRAVAGIGTSGIQNVAFTIIAGCVPMPKRLQLIVKTMTLGIWNDGAMETDEHKKPNYFCISKHSTRSCEKLRTSLHLNSHIIVNYYPPTIRSFSLTIGNRWCLHISTAQSWRSMRLPFLMYRLSIITHTLSN